MQRDARVIPLPVSNAPTTHRTNQMSTTTTYATPDTVYRVSVHNQIYSTIYYVVTGWRKLPNGGWKPFHWQDRGYRSGMRGKGNSLGLTFGEAAELAAELNREKGWTKEMQVLNSKGKVAFDLHA